MKKYLPYHTPDERWRIFNCPDYETYLNSYLIKGKFHCKVPKQILDDYVTIEHLMAIAYYHYPIYDEALSKLLRTIELATKLRCKELFISLTLESNNQKSIQLKKKTFNRLIEDLIKAEPEKNISHLLNNIKDLRNLLMHPENHSYAGGINYPAIISCVTAINILFAEERYFKTLKEKLSSYEKILIKLAHETLFFEKGKEAFLIAKISILDLFYSAESEIINLFIEPVSVIKANKSQEKQFAKPIITYLKVITYTSKEITGIDVSSEQVIRIYPSNNSKFSKIQEAYLKHLSEIDKAESPHYRSFIKSEQTRTIGLFRYKYYEFIT